MARQRKYGEDLTYAEEHRNRLPDLYSRIGHRLDMADRDWTEFCHWCKAPLGIYEEVRDVGQDITDKATTVTRQLASMARLPAFLFAWRVERPAAVQARIDVLHQELRWLESQHQIIGFKARRLHPTRSPVIELSPDEWWQEGVLILHRQHHQWCRKARRQIPMVNGQGLADARNGSRLWSTGDLGQLILPGGAA